MDDAAAEILLVEDNSGDAELMREALRRGKGPLHLNVVSDGQDALSFLRHEGEFAAAPVADLVLLDLNLPGKDGREVLVEIKQDERLRHIPVIVLTASEAEEDIFRSYQSHANCYVTKPVDMQQFLSVVATLEAFWLHMVKLPRRIAVGA